MNSLSIRKLPQMSYACAEAINTLCTNITFSGGGVKKIMLTSCHALEGKSFLSMNVVQTLASLGYRVALVDADLRKSVITSRYKVDFADPEHSAGLAQYLAGMVTAEEVIYKTEVPNLWMVPVGRNVANSLQLLNSPNFTQLLDFLASRLDYVIIDAPPVGQVIDAAEIAKSCDGILLSVRYNAVSRRELLEARDQLMQSGCPILGTVLNQVSYNAYLNKRYYYKAYYKSNYMTYEASDGEAKQAPTRKKRKR